MVILALLPSGVVMPRVTLFISESVGNPWQEQSGVLEARLRWACQGVWLTRFWVPTQRRSQTGPQAVFLLMSPNAQLACGPGPSWLYIGALKQERLGISPYY